MNNKTDLLIIGAGLTGLTIAYLLRDQNMEIKLVEARSRVGGRILSKPSNNNTTIDLGATWIQQPHTHLLKLLNTLNIEIFEQKIGATAIYEPNTYTQTQRVKLPPNNAPSYRIKGGTSHLINTLASFTEPKNIVLNEKVQSIEIAENQLIVKTDSQEFECSQVISTLPPFLFGNSISINPPLYNNINAVLNKTHTWMGESIKAGLVYDQPFWRGADFMGTVFSNVGPIIEFYDHCNFEENQFALQGFVKDDLGALPKEERLELILNQLRKYYGDQVDDYLNYEELVWGNEATTTLPYNDFVLPHQNNGHELFQKTYLDNKLFIAGTETANSFGGYMEGAIRSAEFVVEQVINQKQV